MRTSDIDLCKAVKSRDKEVDAHEVLIQAQCENLFALFQPVAVDLRFIMTAMMISYQLERCGDIAVNITNRVKKTIDFKSLIEDSKIMEMAARAQEMAQEAIESFLHNNVELAEKSPRRTKSSMAITSRSFNYWSKRCRWRAIGELPAPTSSSCRQIERLADTATNIAEDVVFMVDAQIIAHKNKLSNNQS